MTSYFAPLRVKSAEPLQLDMQSLFLSGRVFPFGAKLNVTHTFRSSETSPVEVVYCFPLPRDASLVSFQIAGEKFWIFSRLECASDAQKRYEEALDQGSLAALTQQNRDGLVNLTVGNLRPGEVVSVRLDLIAGVSVSDSGFRLRFPFTVAPCYHSQMRVSLDQPGIGTIELPDDVAANVFLPPFHAVGADLHKIGFELLVDPANAISEIASPSHAVSVVVNNSVAIGVKLAAERDVPNRDLVLDVKCDLGTGRAWSDRAIDGRKHFAAIAPSSAFGQATRTARKIVFLLDRSGSMMGTPIKQARHAIENCLANLSPEDQFGIVAFDSTVDQFREEMLPATRENVEEACAFLNRVDASGGTELASGVEAAARLLTGNSGEVFVITDGQVFGTSEIVQRARKCEVRLFCLGIGSAGQDRFLELLARQTGGICRFVTPSERVDSAAFEVFSAIGGTVATEVRVADANVHPASTRRVFAATPFVAFGDIQESTDTIALEWLEGRRRASIEVLDTESNGLIEKLEGAKMITDFEASYDRSDPAALQALLELSRRYGLSSSEMSLVAVVERSDDEAGVVPKTKIVPVGMAQNVAFTSYFPAPRARVAMFCSFNPQFKRWIHGEESRSSGLLRASLLTANHRDSKYDPIRLVREVVRIVEEYAFVGPDPDANAYLNTALTLLRSEQGRVTDKTHKRALKMLIDYLAGSRDPSTWSAVRLRLEGSWPELTGSEWMPRKEGGDTQIAAEMGRDKALRTFEKSVNQPGTISSTDHWLQPKLEELRALLSDPITQEQATALLDVLYERQRMGDLIRWLQGPPMPWQSFFTLREFVDRGRDTRDNLSIRTEAER